MSDLLSFFLLDILFIYISNVISFPGFPSGNPLSHPPSPCFYEGASPPIHPPTHSHLPTLALPYTKASSSLTRNKGHSSHWCPARPSTATYVAGAVGPSMCTLWLVIQSPGSFRWSVLFNCCAHPPHGPAKPLSFFSPFSNSSIRDLRSVQWVAVSICLCICQPLADTLRRQPYQAPVNKHFWSSAIVSRFGDCIYDGCPGGAVSAPHFVSIFPPVSISKGFIDINRQHDQGKSYLENI